jgi:hypothetical protein
LPRCFECQHHSRSGRAPRKQFPQAQTSQNRAEIAAKTALDPGLRFSYSPARNAGRSATNADSTGVHGTPRIHVDGSASGRCSRPSCGPRSGPVGMEAGGTLRRQKRRPGRPGRSHHLLRRLAGLGTSVQSLPDKVAVLCPPGTRPFRGPFFALTAPALRLPKSDPRRRPWQSRPRRLHSP